VAKIQSKKRVRNNFAFIMSFSFLLLQKNVIY